MVADQAFQQRMQQIEGLVAALEAAADPATRAQAQELLQLVLELHGAGLERMLDLATEAGEPGAALIDGFAHDELIASLLLLHGLHPLDAETRVIEALDSVRPYMESHGGNVELLSVEGESVRLRLEGSCSGCPSSAMTLQNRIEEAIQRAAPDIATIEVEGLAEPPPARSFIPLALVT